MQEHQSSVLGQLFSTDFFRKQRLLDDFHVKYEGLDYWMWLTGLYSDWLNQPSYAQIVPKLIHQIWLGSSFPKKYIDYQKSWQSKNPDYGYMLWTDNDIKKLNLYNSQQYQASSNLGVKSDIARYEILYKYGGIYVDTDFECLRPFDNQFLSRSFLAGQLFSYSPQLANGLIIAEPKSKFLKIIIESLPQYPGDMSPMEVLRYCGPFYISELLWKHHLQLDNILVLPSQYFYPWPNYERHRAGQRYDWVSEESAAIHHWESSWMKKRTNNKMLDIIKKVLQ